MCKTTILSAAVALGALLALSAAAQAGVTGYTFTEINVPGSQPGSTGFFGIGINDKGQIVGDYVDSAGQHGFFYTNGQYSTIDAPGAIDTQALGINDRGQILGISCCSNGIAHVFIDRGGVFTNVADLRDFSSPFGINDNGQILGQNHGYPALYTHGVITPVDVSGAPGIGPPSMTGLNDSGQLVGTYFDDAGLHGVVDTKGVYTTIDDLDAGPGGGTLGSGISDNGQIVGAFFDSTGLHGFLDKHGVFTTIDDPSASEESGGTWATGVNDPGQIVGFYYDSGGLFHSFLATPIHGLALMAAIEPTSVPEPSTWAMMLIGFAGLGYAGFRRTRKSPHFA
jgi:hypothetical protein